MSRFIQYLGVALLSLMVHFLFYSTDILRNLDYKFYDLSTTLFTKAKRTKSGSYSVIINIDEKSIQVLGQWPWARVLDAKLINAIHQMNPSALGINILFPEEDRVSPVNIQKFYKRYFNLTVKFSCIPSTLNDNDQLLAKAIKASNAVLSTYFSNEAYTAKHCEALNYKKNFFSQRETTFTASALLCNTPVLQKGIENFGFINATVDKDGIFRRVPFFMRYKEKIFPSFALATLLSFDNYLYIKNPTNNILINFSHSKPKILSAIDVLRGEVDPKDIQGKIAILGSSVVGLNPSYIIYNGEQISNSMIHAMAINNILDNSILTQPKKYKKINLILSFLLSLILILLFIKRLYFYSVLLLATTFLSSFIWLMNAYNSSIYLSIAYLWIPLSIIFITIMLYNLRVINKEQREQETLLIRQSKLASMGEMISLIAHQWRQPLSAINGVVLKLDIDYRKEKLHPKRLEEHLDEIEKITAYLSRTIQDFTSFFSINKESVTFFVEDVITQAINLTTISSYKNIEIICNKKESIELISFKSELIQSLLVLLNNAIFACAKKSSQEFKGEIIIDTYRLKKYVYISVSDNAGGIPKEHLKKIFDPYFTTKKKSGGTGLGLYILKLIVEDSMNGKILVKNGIKGAIFTLQIPMN